MSSYILQRFINLGFLLLLMSIVVFTTMHMIPGDPVDVLYGTEEGISEETRAVLKHRLGLDQPLPIQYLRWLGRFLQGDWGTSYFKRRSVFDLVIDRLPSTFLLTISSTIFAVIVSVPLGILAANQHHSYFDHTIVGVASLAQSIPGFWLGIILMLLLALKLQWLPTFGFVSPSENLLEALRHLIMPSITLGMPMTTLLLRMVRSNLLEELNKEYILTAKAKGIPDRTIVLKHALRNALIPSVTMIGMWFGFAMSGSVVVETIFTWPGVGKLLLDSIFSRDYPVVQSIVLVNSTIFVLANLTVDVLYSSLDPRIRITSKHKYR